MIFTGDYLSDLIILTEYLDEIEFYSGTERKKMLYVPQKQGGSMLYGITWRGYLSPNKTRTPDPETGLYRTKCYDLYPHLKDIFREFADFHFPNHEWEQVQLNRNFPCPVHKDSTNIGASVLVCCGDYEGGLTCVEKEDKILKFDARNSPIKFDGSKYYHWVEPIKNGTRYSLVFFSNASVRKKIKKKNLI